MRDRMERLVVLPFSIGCTSQSSIAVVKNHPKKSKPQLDPFPIRVEEEEWLSDSKVKGTLGFLTLPKPPNISSGIHKLIKSFKSFSQLFVYKEENEEMNMEMDIGFPTDVKHVTHIGCDGSATTDPLKGWDNLKGPELLSLPTLSLRQFELAMAAQADAPLVNDSKLK